ncbi:MAG: hypothetical protein WC503_01785 [Candidatus Shapirobacteria bacterium]
MSKENHSVRRFFSFNLIPSLCYRINIDKESKEKISEISDLLVRRPELSFIVYSNHISYPDPLYEAYISRRLDHGQNRHLIAPVSYSHTDPSEPRGKLFSALINEAQQCGVETIRVIQSYQINDPEFGYSQEQATATYKNWLRHLQELGKSHTPTGVMINPEGHRSDTGILDNGESGVIACGRLLPPAIYIPLGIHYDHNFDRNGANLFHRVNLTIGNTFIQETAKDSPSLDLLMRNLASTLPVKMRGNWK